MSDGPTRIAGRGACIYCGRTDGPLTDEHILPLSLGGVHILEKASCLSCADITKRFEQEVARGLWGDARIAYNAPSRRKNERKTHIILSDPDVPGRRLKVPYNEYPAGFVFYQMFRAGILEGLPSDLDISSRWQMKVVMDDAKAKEFEKKYSSKPTMKFKHVPDSFGRLIAKIGYGQVLTVLSPEDFYPICLPYILGTEQNVSYVVGGRFEIEEPVVGKGYVLKTAAFGDFNRLILIAEVRLYASNYTPTYHVVVGDVVGRGKIIEVIEKLGPGEFVPTDSISVSSNDASTSGHWMPKQWPLPFFRI